LNGRLKQQSGEFPYNCGDLRLFVRWTTACGHTKTRPTGLRVTAARSDHGSVPSGPPKGEHLVSHADDTTGTRRDFLYYATAGAGAVAAGAAVWPLINQMNPSADVRGLSSIFVDVSAVEVGTQLTVKWRGKPVFIRRRAAEEIEAARAVPLTDLVDPLADNANLDAAADASDVHRTLDEAGEWLVMMGVCTHLGCVPLGDGAGDFGGWFCPCHGSHYDTAGRIRRGPAPRNLPVPVAAFTDETTIKLG
jgi:ubiquinol-cytochrome c reductase iron-sulfur subunit